MDKQKRMTGWARIGPTWFRRAGAAVLVGVCLYGTGCAHTELSKRVVLPPDEAITRLKGGGSLDKEVEQLVLPLIASEKITGVAVGALCRANDCHYYGFGATGGDGSLCEPSEDTLFAVGPLSKLMIVTVYYSLEQDGALDGSETVRELLPGDWALSDDIAEVTLYDLLTHTAGFPRELRTRRQFAMLLRYLFTGRNLYGYMDYAWLKEYLRTCSLKRAPEKERVYSNLGMALLAHLLERLSGESFPDLAHERIFVPLQMLDTGYAVPEDKRYRLAWGHAGDQPFFIRRNAPLDDWDMGALMRPMGGLYSTTHDLLLFVRAAMGGGDSPLASVFARMREPVAHATETDPVPGWRAWRDEAHDLRLLYKHGMVAGYSSYLGFCPERGVAV
ncbi:MAG: class A beta-lactamase-related serine hydrolase, partial [Spartobacteria bacterium]|nr:class A beta-lactamase-related serine hydrolase [Spartobacteria bacterium]